MSWVESTVYALKCDNCGTCLTNWDDESWFGNKSDALDAYEDYEWFSMNNGNYSLCEDCRFSTGHLHLWHYMENHCLICLEEKPED